MRHVDAALGAPQERSTHWVQRFLPVHCVTAYSLELPDKTKKKQFAFCCRGHAALSETCGMCPWCHHPWLSMVYSKQYAGAEQRFTLNNYASVAEPGVSFYLLLHHTRESKAILEACSENCSGIHMHTTAHDKCVRGWFEDLVM